MDSAPRRPDLDGKVAVVTGGAGGIGRSLCLALARAGADVAVADLDERGVAGVAREVAELGRRALAVRCDVTSDADVERMAAQVLDRLGRADVLANNAGVSAVGPVEKLPLDDWRWVLEVNVLGVVRGVRALLPHMLERGSGHIVNTASSAGLFPVSPVGLAYSTSKFAVVGFSQGLAVHLRPRGIGVACLCPGVVRTGFGQGVRVTEVDTSGWLPPDVVRHEPDEVAELVIEAIGSGRFLILTDPEHQAIMETRAHDLDRAIETGLGLLNQVGGPRSSR